MNMKRKLVISGNQDSGKTVLTQHITQLFALNKVLVIEPRQFFNGRYKFSEYDLIVIEGCTHEEIKQIGTDWKISNMPVIFTTLQPATKEFQGRTFNTIQL